MRRVGRVPKISLSYAGLSYLDRTAALERGDVRPEGIDLTFVRFDTAGELFKRQRTFASFDASEMSLSNFVMMTARGDDRFVGLPVFPSRQFRHKDLYVNVAAGVDSPEQLVGHDVGVLQYQMTAALWIRGILQHDYGVAPDDVRWWTGGLTTPGVPAGDSRSTYEHEVDGLRRTLPAGTALSLIRDDQTLEGMLEDGSLAALVTSRPPRAFTRRTGAIRRVFADYRRVERAYFTRTGFFPIMHLVVLRRDVYHRHPWVACSLAEAFGRAKAVGYRRLRSLGTLAVTLPWLAAELEEVDELFGGDAFPYGVEPNWAVLEATLAYSFEQGLAPRKVDVSELFAPETRELRFLDPVGTADA